MADSSEVITLQQLPLGSFGRVVELNLEGLARRRMLDLGLVVNSVVETVRRSPAGDPIAFCIRGALIALREEESSLILVNPIPK